MPGFIWVIIIVALVLGLQHLLTGKASRRVVREKLAQGATVVDVRTPREFEHGHYEGAVHIPLGELSSRLDELGAKETTLILYCHSGARAVLAARTLKRAGYTDVVNAGSLHAMYRAGSKPTP